MPVGFCFIEVLLSLLILAFLYLGINAMQLYALHATQEAYYLSVAENQIQGMVERLLHIETQDALSNKIALWNEQNKIVLPNGVGKVFKKLSEYHIEIFWGKGLEKECSTSNKQCLERIIL